VDHSDLAQSPDDLKDANILGIVDHHKLGDVTTGQPLECWIWPVGCTCTVIKSMYNFFNVEITKEMAGLMLCAIISDTVIFKSATCTDSDKKVCAQLSEICGESDLDALGIEMFKVKSAVEGTPIRELVFRDYKDFDMKGIRLVLDSSSLRLLIRLKLFVVIFLLLLRKLRLTDVTLYFLCSPM